VDRIKFDSIDQYLEFLDNRFAKIDAVDSFNVYLHQLGDVDQDLLNAGISREVLYERMVESFAKNGLDIRYGALAGTARFVGNCININSQDVLRYAFDRSVPHNAVAIFAIPKYVDIDGRNVEFSSVEGKSIQDRVFYQNLKILYGQNGMTLAESNMKCCLYDVVKGKNLPSMFLVGIQEVDKQTGTIAFVDPHTHMTELSDQEREEIGEALSQKVETAYEEYGTTIIGELLVKSTKKEYLRGDYEKDFEI